METTLLNEQVSRFKALSDPKRLKILFLLRQEELCACKILETFEMSQSTLSHHMKILTQSALVVGRNEGKWTHYSLNPETGNELTKFLEGLYNDTFAMAE